MAKKVPSIQEWKFRQQYMQIRGEQFAWRVVNGLPCKQAQKNYESARRSFDKVNKKRMDADREERNSLCKTT